MLRAPRAPRRGGSAGPRGRRGRQRGERAHQPGQAALGLQRPVDAGDELSVGMARGAGGGGGDDVGRAGPRVGTQGTSRAGGAPVERDPERLLPGLADPGPHVDRRRARCPAPGGVGDEVEAAVEHHRAGVRREEVGVGRRGVRAVGVAVEAQLRLAERLAQQVDVPRRVGGREVAQALAGGREARPPRLRGRGPEPGGPRGTDGGGHPVAAERAAVDGRGRPRSPGIDGEEVEACPQAVEPLRRAGAGSTPPGSPARRSSRRGCRRAPPGRWRAGGWRPGRSSRRPAAGSPGAR